MYSIYFNFTETTPANLLARQRLGLEWRKSFTTSRRSTLTVCTSTNAKRMAWEEALRMSAMARTASRSSSTRLRTAKGSQRKFERRPFRKWKVFAHTMLILRSITAPRVTVRRIWTRTTIFCSWYRDLGDKDEVSLCGCIYGGGGSRFSSGDSNYETTVLVIHSRFCIHSCSL